MNTLRETRIRLDLYLSGRRRASTTFSYGSAPPPQPPTHRGITIMQDYKKGTNAVHSLCKEWDHGMGCVTNNKRFI